uniref:Putative hemolectin n=1 Tax=Cupiennius salei TaxID=6928 RepID=A0A061QFX2_CUPSA
MKDGCTVPFSNRRVLLFTLCLLLLQYHVLADEEDELASVSGYDDLEHNCEEPPPPLNGELLCGKHKKKSDRYVCKAKCDPGYQFPNKKTKGKHGCDLNTGEWFPKFEFPDCEPICTPPCHNNGKCSEGNHCICTPQYRGDRCQYALDLCEPENGLGVSAEWMCNDTPEETTCVMNCPQGTRYESPPAEEYHCSLAGSWTPSFAPKCIPINVIEPPAANGMYPSTTNQMISSAFPNSGVCAVWGTSHYRTYDGGIYSFQGPCTYLLSKDCEQNTFAINIQNEKLCETVSSCSTTLAIYIGSEQYLLTNGEGGGPIVEKGGEVYTIPNEVHGLLFQVLADYVTVKSSLGFSLKWNRKNTVLLSASNQLRNRTCGLCGKFDGSVLNDLETSDGSITDSVEGFVNSWTMDDLGERCEKKAVVKDSCSENKEKAPEAEKLCGAIFDDKFSQCHDLVDPKVYFEVCKMDHCACPFNSCYCGTLAEYFRECTRLGGKLDGGWRSSELCPLSCPDGMIYKDCGTSCPKTCKGTLYDCEDNHCVDGCHCPDGMLLQNGRCVEKRDCPCMHGGKEYQSGERIPDDCNACECNAGEWTCTNEKCEATCTSSGDPHYTTFDGLKYDFYGSCSYYLVYNDNFTIVQETGPCSASSGSEPATDGMYCTNKVEVKYLHETLILEPGIKATFNEKNAKLPISASGISASMATDVFLKVTLLNGLSVLWDGQNRIYINAPPSMYEQTAGLCGTFNNKQKDDFLTPTNDIEADVSTFAARWEVSDSCHKRSRRRSARAPCESQPQKLKDAELLCSALKLDIFKDCHEELEPMSYYKSCVSDLCLCTQGLAECLCPIVADYSLACTQKGIVVDWVEVITACKPQCTGGQIYQECSNPCTSSCAAIAASDMCIQLCVQGCACAEGTALNSEGFCVPVDQCPCIYEDKEYLPSSVTVQGSNVCTCQGAKWQCRPGTLAELASLNSNFMIDDDSFKCLAENNEEYTQCRESCPRTCQTMHLRVDCKTEECKPGCRCKDGYLFDSKLSRCVKESECGCVHGQRRYREGETIKQACNLCTCSDGAWQCTMRECPAVCSVWGESHFKTFDGKIFDFHGDCEYVLSKGKTKDTSYSLSVQNVPCGTSGITCSKSFTLELGVLKVSRGDVEEVVAQAESLTLTRDDPVPKTTFSSRFVVVESGLFVTVFTDIGLSLQWDRGTRIYVTAEPRWRGRMKGLCGNFNDDQADDFLTPSGGIPEARPSLFAESWKIHEFCPHPQTIEDACEIHPHRKSWAQQKCGILKSEAFSNCHSEVAMEPYYERCVFDSCACDMGGDCECLCTAVAAYAQECNMHGVPVKWRSQELCPIQCEECATYDSCMSSCPKKTCEHGLIYDRIEQACSEFCVEGCNPKPCPEGQIYNNGKEYKCIPEIDCVVPCMELNGKIYNEGDRITDPQVADTCQTCHCIRGSISCVGQPCVATQEIRPCIQNGWTPWMTTSPLVGGDYEVLTDPKLKAVLQSYCGIANMTDIDCRAVDTKQPYKETGQQVTCQLPIGLYCKDEDQKDTVCADYEIRVYCDCGPIPTTEAITTTTTIPKTLPPVCDETGWTEWMSGNLPDEQGEFETLGRLRVNHYFCEEGMIENIECRTKSSWRLVSEEDEDIICNKKVGLVCRGSQCDDYEVRVYCNCGEETTPPVPACVTGWTEYFNTDHPDISDTGDDESLDRIRERYDFCIGGTIQDIECKAIIGGQLVDYKELGAFGVKCSKKVGFQCNQFIRPQKCEDFTVRFFCACEPIPETTTTTVKTSTSTTPIPITPVPVACGWTPWLNIDSPDYEGGDFEDLTKIQMLYKTCGGKDLVDIECRMARTLHKYSDSLQNNLICNTEQGFRCLNEDQIGKCYDYEVRLLCMYSWCYPPTTTPVPTTTTQNPCPEGKVYDICAFHCNQLCSSLASKLAEDCRHSPDECIPGCRPAEGCEHPKMWRDYYTCVSKEDCICAMPDENGTIINIAPNEVISIGCEKCQCLENDMTCHDIPECGVTEVTGKPRKVIIDIVNENCWTDWINIDKPIKGGGDLEVPSNIRKIYEYCQEPVKIECRTAVTHQRPLDAGQIVVCDVKEGLICWNKDNKPEECYDYEIRFFCPCPSQTTTTTTPVPPTLPPGPCLFGWTEWYNSHVPGVQGDYETIQSSRISNSFCSSDMVSAIQCRQVGKNVGELQSGVICDLDIGLKCNPEYLFGDEQCGDYEVRFFCDCPTMAPTIEPLPPLITTPPARLACSYWSEWINENHPNNGGEGTKKGGIKGGGGSRGDTEKVMLLKLQREYDFCQEGYLSDIECREASTDLNYNETGDKKLACSVASGFRCRGRDQPNHRCKDYKIRYFCSCSKMTIITETSVKPTTPAITVPPCTDYYKVVDGPSPLPDSRLKASSSRDTSSGPQSAKLSSEYGTRSAGAWIAGKLNDLQFIEMDLGQIQPLYGVITKGRSGHDEWVKSYKVLYSRDGDAYHYVRDPAAPNGEKIFTGNYDSETEVEHLFWKPFEARFVRIQPVTFYKSIAMRVDVLGCASDMEVLITTPAPLCVDEMGMYNGSIKDNQISTSSNRNWSTDGRYARLNTPQTEDHTGGWVADELNDKQYIQVDFKDARNLTGVKTQGRDMVPQWVTAFYISYSQNGMKWNKIKDEGGTVIFPGNYDSGTTVITYFNRPIRAQFLRIHPVFWENWIAMRFEVLGCYEPLEEVKDEIPTTPKPIIVSEVCTEPMGFEDNTLPDTLISVSSSNGSSNGASRIRLNTHQEGLSTGGWIPASYDYMPKVYIDFYEPRNLTGIVTQGLEDDDLWVVSYKIAYSVDNVTWDFATDMDNNGLVFSGNFDRNSEVLRLFSKMITARFLEVIILDYHTAPALRMEVLGCFIPYPVYTPLPVLQTTTEICVENGPWISLSDPALSSFGDEEPIDKVISSSGVCRNPFEIQCRTHVTKKDASETGQVVTCDLSRGLICKNAHQSSYQCYNYEVRIKCWTCGGTTEVTPAPLPLEMCPEIPDTFRYNCPESCPYGFACDGTTCVPSPDCPCFRDGKRFEPSNMLITEDCHTCECILGGHSRCEPINCPDCLPGQKPEMDSNCHCGCVGCAVGTSLCPTSGECIKEEQWCDGFQDCPDDETGCPTTPAPTTTTLPTTSTEMPFICSTDFAPDTDTCEMLANVFETFDGLTYQYDVCDHVLMKESSSGLYSVSVHKLCSAEGPLFCYRHLVIDVDGVIIKIGPGIEDVTIKDNKVSVANLWLASLRYPDFDIKKSGNTIVFRSYKYNFDVTWNSIQDVRITVSRCLVYNIMGLCGLYNKHLADDLTTPNGVLASGSQEFGDSWAIGSLEKCLPQRCQPETMKTAIEICNALREDPFQSSCSEYVIMENRIEACITFMCECMQRPIEALISPSKDVMYDFLGAETCKCQAYESFVEACEAFKQRPVQEWRIQHDCTPECPEGMEWQDCGSGCELTCDNYHQRSEICGSACVPGCYCPSGLIRHHNRCVKPKMCQDCVCRGHGDPNYITFDGRYYAFQGVCTYILAQHQTSEDEAMNFRVLATNEECPEEPHTSCTQGLTIYWNGHVIEKFKDKPVYLNEKPLRTEDLPLEYGGISITYVPNKSTVIHIKEINLAVRYFDQMYGFNVELPAFFYFNKTEGLCGVCNFIQSDDLYHREGYVSDNVEDFAYSWLVERETRENCELTRVEVPEPRPSICNFTTSPCEVLLDPTLYSKSCQNDITYSQKPEASMCRSKFQYAQQCCERGVSLMEWLKLSGCESSCPEGMVYECSSACQRTCDNYKNYQADDCSLMPLYTCNCPEGKVLKLGKCVETIQCEVCDSQGHIIGDVWQEGPCKRCECLPDLSVNCVVMECPLPPLCNEGEHLQKVDRSADECCDAFLCMPKEEVICPEVPLEECPPGQAYVKDYVNGCPVFRCECIPDLCPPPIVPMLDDGENFTLVTIDCCTQFRTVCDLDSCIPPPRCNPGFKLSTYEGRCCNKYTCIPRNDVCVYQHKYDVVNGTQVDLPLEEHYDVEYEPGSSWQDGFCRKCSCVELSGQFTYSCKEEICPNPSEFPDADKYFREEIHIPGACCPKYRRTACVVEGVKYEIDEEWPSPEGNPCKSYRCIFDNSGEAVRLEKTTICDRSCPDYAAYTEASPESGKCCGICKPIACEENGNLYENGETWVSTSKPCFTAECLVTENGTRITYRGESCPIMPDNCAPENVRSDPKGCCTYCKKPTDTCSPVEVPLYETRGFFGYVDKQKGFCSNEQVLRGLTKCGGQCSTETLYSNLIGDFQGVCNCCLPRESQNRTVLLDCEDGSRVEKVYMQPVSCECLSCSGGNSYLDDLNKVEPYRK